MLLLIRDLEKNAPATGGGWKNYGKLKGMPGDNRHCHLSKGRRTIVKELARRIADIFGLDYRIFL